MKVKLLKKVRDRYEIIYYPTGTSIFLSYINKPLMILYDKKENHGAIGFIINSDKSYTSGLFSSRPTIEESKKSLLCFLSIWIKDDYHYTRKRKVKRELIWYNGK